VIATGFGEKDEKVYPFVSEPVRIKREPEPASEVRQSSRIFNLEKDDSEEPEDLDIPTFLRRRLE
jgi:hypothetical protein